VAAAVVQIIDCSGSMAGLPLSTAQADASIFANIMTVGDRLGMSAFSDTAFAVWPTTPNTNVLGSRADMQAAGAAIRAVNSRNMTNITAAIALGHSMLSQAPPPRGMVLLSDGVWNVGGDPRTSLPTDIPIHTIALGAFNSGFLQDIAKRTGGTYHQTPDAWGLADVYAAIASLTDVAQLVQSTQAQVAQYVPQNTNMTLTAAQPQVSFSVNWLNTGVQYTPGMPTGEQVTVGLRDPSGNHQPVVASGAGPGYAVFDLPAPAAGQWTVGVVSSSASTLKSTVGGFEYGGSLKTSLHLTEANARVGGAVDYALTVVDGDEPVEKLRVDNQVIRPLRPLEESLRLGRDELAAADVPQPEEGESRELAALRALREAGRVLHPFVSEPAPSPTPDGGGGLAGTTGECKVHGEHTLKVRITGTGPLSGPFMRQAQRSFFATDET
jgi:hypothetical protein